jgi:hypothetical protein
MLMPFPPLIGEIIYGTCPFWDDETTEVNKPLASTVIVDEQLQLRFKIILRYIPLHNGNLAKKSAKNASGR